MSRNGRYPAVKRAIDVATVILVAPSFVILIGVAAAAIALTMGRPIFFTQNRVGRGGKVFSMYKLRTMRPRVEGEPVRATAENDPRITPLGRMLRQYHVDELPQIWNVLKGEMSLIGPRPEQPELVRIYSEQMPAYAFRHTVRPGITGWSQVCFGYAENFQETREKLTYDLHYVKFLSLALDVKVAMMTIRTLVSGPPVR
jgi:lipopolysaccharide/colanic/teichoic acid biosynthesis glycosyltransferase